MARAEYHVHVNAFGEEPTEAGARLIESGFSYKKSEIFLDGACSYIGLYTRKCATPSSRDRIFADAVSLIRSGDMFVGYAEAESISPELVRKFPFTPFDTQADLPSVPAPAMVPNRKNADVHVYLPRNPPSDVLARFFLSLNFYEVRTPSKRIFTLEAESMFDAKKLYRMLCDFFSRNGGVMEIECETISRIEPAHANFEFRKVAQRGFTDHDEYARRVWQPV